MTVSDLKKYIFDTHKIEDILKDIGCHHILYHASHDYYSCGNIDGDNRSAIIIKNNEYLSCKNYTREKEFPEQSDLITLVQYNLKVKHQNNDFHSAMIYLHKFLGLRLTYKMEVPKVKDETNDPLCIFNKIKRRKYISHGTDYVPLDESIINDFVPYAHIDFVHESIMPWTWDKFGICYSYVRKRTVIPMRYWLTGELLGFNMRTSVPNYELFGIKKYWITPGYKKQINLYGLYENKNYIHDVGYVVVFEAEKSVLKRDSMFDSTGVAVSGHELSDEQVKILIGLNVEIVIAFDNDIDIDYIRYCCEKFYGIRNISYIYDKSNILDVKDSPADAGDKNYKYLFEHRIKYDATEHIKYLSSIKAVEE